MPAILSVRPTGALSTVNFDDGTSFRCTRDFARRSNLFRGQQIDSVFVDRLRDSAAFDLARAQAERLNQRGRLSRQEIAVRMQQTGIREPHIGAALSDLTERGELDDLQVALASTRRNLGRELSRNPDLTWSRFRNTQGRRLALRGFGAHDSAEALRQAWTEVTEPPLARGR
ncbi:MAG: RecX family transcriptional regulator [Chloroflexota bacterium]|nr:RecX family transcriptional regulator [Chloroflexota bacterium]MDE2894172.1 RecX family transcriptional regulator [Chloroflexota bacterium]